MAKKVIVKIHSLIEKRGISLRELSRRSDVRHPTLSELANQKRENINFSQMERIADACEVTDIREIIDFIDVDDES
jgi:DNA-binding Xre family transcriptional regulator